ncbi:HipA N-terminal domain-containing protein [Roseateles sp. PN1]|uniref:HipA N-terminal domain-containing protein n=1 Tax=Roseateles sp. PN1 TaxID=3137372 RepID=UPI00313895B8
MGRHSHTRTLNLWMNGAFVGTWSLAPNAPDTFQYDLAWTRSEQGRPLSLSLPFTPGTAATGSTPTLKTCCLIARKSANAWRAGSELAQAMRLNC